MVKMQRHVEWFTGRISKRALTDAKRTEGCNIVQPGAGEPEVTVRIQRALYRYQLPAQSLPTTTETSQYPDIGVRKSLHARWVS